MMHVRFLGLSAAIVAMTAQPVMAAATEQEFCFTRTETRMALSYLTPLLVEGVVKSCAPYMSEDSSLLQLGPKMAENYRTVANATDADMMALFAKIGGVIGEAPPKKPIETIKTELVSRMAKDIKAEDCVIADKFAVDVAALPATNMLGLIETILFMTEFKDRQKKAKRTKKPIAASVFCEG